MFLDDPSELIIPVENAWSEYVVAGPDVYRQVADQVQQWRFALDSWHYLPRHPFAHLFDVGDTRRGDQGRFAMLRRVKATPSRPVTVWTAKIALSSLATESLSTAMSSPPMWRRLGLVIPPRSPANTTGGQADDDFEKAAQNAAQQVHAESRSVLQRVASRWGSAQKNLGFATACD